MEYYYLQEKIDLKKVKTFSIKNKKILIKELEEYSGDESSIENTNNEIEFFVKPLLEKYNEFLLGFGVNLNFQDFDEEVKNLPGAYSKNKRGSILLILNYEEDKTKSLKYIIPAGMVSLKNLSNSTCEMKRLFLLEDFRGMGLGKLLMDSIIKIAKDLGYTKFRWDSLKKLTESNKLYEKYNYKKIDPYNYNPFSDVLYFELDFME